jgi:DNA replication licensing factor MCM2
MGNASGISAKVCHFVFFLYLVLTDPHLANSESLEVSYLHLAVSKPIIAYFLTNSPSAMLVIFDEVALNAILVYYPAYERIHSEVHVRISDLPLSTSLRDLRRTNLNNLVRVSGVVTRRSGVFPQLKYVKFDCKKCGAVLGPFYQDATKEVKISYCANCEGKGPFSVNSEQVSVSLVIFKHFIQSSLYRRYTETIRR